MDNKLTADEMSVIACNKLREVFKESMEIPHPVFGKLDYSDDNNVIKAFTDEWTWYMQGWKDTVESLSPSPDISEQKVKDGFEETLQERINYFTKAADNKDYSEEYRNRCEIMIGYNKWLLGQYQQLLPIQEAEQKLEAGKSDCKHIKMTDRRSGMYVCKKCGIGLEGEEYDNTPFDTDLQNKINALADKHSDKYYSKDNIQWHANYNGYISGYKDAISASEIKAVEEIEPDGLKDLSEITDEDCIEVAKLLNNGRNQHAWIINRENYNCIWVENTADDSDDTCLDFKGGIEQQNAGYENFIKAHQYLQSKNYKLPVYFHPPISESKEAVEFVEWIKENKYEYSEQINEWFNENFPNAMSIHWNKYYTSKELYQLFLTSKR